MKFLIFSTFSVTLVWINLFQSCNVHLQSAIVGHPVDQNNNNVGNTVPNDEVALKIEDLKDKIEISYFEDDNKRCFQLYKILI